MVCNLNNLSSLDLSYNKLSGRLPQCLSNFSSDLSILNLRSNKFHGSIPGVFTNETNLRMIDLSHNLLQGRIPRSLANCTMLEFLNLGNNHISDTFPSWLGTLGELKVLILQSNRFWGVIREPETKFTFPQLHIIDLSHNRFTGNLPTKYFECWNAMKVVNASQLTYMQDAPQTTRIIASGTHARIGFFIINFEYSLNMITKGIELEYGKISNILTAISFSSNRFEGQIPASIGNLRGLHFLNLSNNSLQGPIPSSMGNLITLESLDLSQNLLSGQIPQQLTELTFLAFFNVSCNHLTGLIPQGKQFDTFQNNSFDGNPGLCGKPLSKKCANFEAFRQEDPASESGFEIDWKIILTGYASGLIIGLVLGHSFTTRKRSWFVQRFVMQPTRKR